MSARALAAIAIALPLTGCGQTGALYLPDEGTSTPVEIRPIGAGTAAPASAGAPAPTDAATTPAPVTPANDDERKPAGASAPAPTSSP